jgi:cytochrome c oxidase subunit 4
MSEHIVPPRVYYTVFAVLMACTYLTWQIAYFDLSGVCAHCGGLNAFIAIAIAVFKASIVVLFFMHVKYSTRLTRAVVVGSLLWLGIFLALTMNDYLTRSWQTFGTTSRSTGSDRIRSTPLAD